MQLKTILKRLYQGVMIIIISFFVMQGWFFVSTMNQIISSDAAPDGYTIALVLGASVQQGQPGLFLQDRLDTAVVLYESGAIDRLVVSGDNGTVEYNEVSVMSSYLMDGGVPASVIFQDYAGFDTYDSIYRAREIFQIEKMIIVTQHFHLPRAVAIANDLGLDVVGVVADRHRYPGIASMQLRELGARTKAFIEIVFGSQAKFGGEVIDIKGESNTVER